MIHLAAKLESGKPITALCFIGRYREISHEYLTTDEKSATCSKCLKIKESRRTR